MKMQRHGPTHVSISTSRYTVFFSYEVPVAVFLAGTGLFFASSKESNLKNWSNTTSTHIRKSVDFILNMETDWSKEFPQIDNDTGVARGILTEKLAPFVFSRLIYNIEHGGALMWWDKQAVDKVLEAWKSLEGEL